MAVTKLENLINPQVIADFVEKKLIDKIVFAPLATVRTDLVGKAGDTLSFPVWSYIGDAENVDEGEAISIANLGQTKADVKVHKIGKGVGITDESILSGLDGDRAVAEAVDQIVKSIADKVDKELLTAMNTASLTYAYNADLKGAVNVAKALEKFGEDMEGDKVLVIPAAKYSDIISEIVPNTDNGANILHTGNVGMIMGCQVVVSNRLTSVTVSYALTSDVAIDSSKTYYTRSGSAGAYVYTKVTEPNVSDIGTYYEKTETATNEAFIVKPGALSLVSKRDTMVEFDRDPSKQINYVFGSKLYAPYLYDATKIVKITF